MDVMYLQLENHHLAKMLKIFIVVCALLFGFGCEGAAINANGTRVCIIGAGVSGLSSARYLKEAGIDFVILETTNYIGGTWRYEERVGLDEYGRPILSSMYKNLRTNVPKIAMELPGFPIPEDAPSFLPWSSFYDYIKSYARHFKLEEKVKLLHEVTSVKRVENSWVVKYESVPTGEEFEEDFEYVIIATGHVSHPHMPHIPGEDVFLGNLTHSHGYRVANQYKDQRVLIIGAGPSALDISLEVGAIAREIVHSHHTPLNLTGALPFSYVSRPDVREINETGAIFKDGTFEAVDSIIYCTGFEFHYPFLDESCGLEVFHKFVKPLHKRLVNINHPTMLVMVGEAVISLDAQARYVAALIKGDFHLPSRELMLDEWETENRDILMGHRISLIELIAQEDAYYGALSQESGIERVKPVISSIVIADAMALLSNPSNFRNYIYTVIDDEHFTVSPIENATQNVSLTSTL